MLLEADLPRAISGAECIVVAVPSQAFRNVTAVLRDYSGVIVSVTKGIEYETGLTMCGILGRTRPVPTAPRFPAPPLPSRSRAIFPRPLWRPAGIWWPPPMSQLLFNRPAFRVYTSTDLLGVELGGALKNVIAIAAGIGDGLGFGDNSKAALVTRAIVEIRRLGVACGAQADTFTGLSGLGDLMVTCFSRHSRNRGFGERVGRGEKPAEIAASMSAVAEGYPTARSAYQLARKHDLVTPVIDEVYAMLYEGKDIRRAVADLMSRDLKPED